MRPEVVFPRGSNELSLTFVCKTRRLGLPISRGPLCEFRQICLMPVIFQTFLVYPDICSILVLNLCCLCLDVPSSKRTLSSSTSRLQIAPIWVVLRFLLSSSSLAMLASRTYPDGGFGENGRRLPDVACIFTSWQVQ